MGTHPTTPKLVFGCMYGPRRRRRRRFFQDIINIRFFLSFFYLFCHLTVCLLASDSIDSRNI